MTDDLTELPGVGKETANKLIAAGYNTYMAIAVARPKNLMEIEGISENASKKIIEAAKKVADIGEFMSLSELIDKRKNRMRLTTSSPQLDALFGGGLETTSVVEFFGEFGSGKTQTCFQLAVNATMPVEKGGLDGHVAWIDTENTFSEKRVRQISEAMGLDFEEDVLPKIHYARAWNSHHQMLLLEERAYELAKAYPIKLIVIDSLTSLFRAEYIGRGTLAERQGLLNDHMHKLSNFVGLNNAVAVFTNQVQSNPGQLFGDPTKPVGGHIVGHNATHRIYLRKGKQGRKVARMIDSPENPDVEALILVEECGVRDG